MNKRISREELFMEVAILFSKRATCVRGQVGAVLVRDNRIVSTGYNGTPSGMKHCSEEIGCDINKPCTNSIHAEANAIYYAARNGIKTEGCILYVTTQPCKKCSEAIIQAGIKEVWYMNEYHDNSGLLLLKNTGIKINYYEDHIQNY